MDRNRTRRAAHAELASRRGHRTLARAADRQWRIVADDIDVFLQPDHRTRANFLPRLVVGSRPQRSKTTGGRLDCLRDPRAGCAASLRENREHAMTEDLDPDFAPIANRIRDSVGQQGFMALIGAELCELARGSCTLLVDRRPELLQQHGLFHGGVTAFLVDNATTIAAATSRGQPALTAEYKLNLLSPASGERLVCPARVVKPGRQVAVVAADVFCLIDGVEKHTATALASIAMLDEKAPARIASPA